MHTARSWLAFVQHARQAVLVAITLGAAACPPVPIPPGGGGQFGVGGLLDITPIGQQIDRTITNISTDVTRWGAELDGLTRYLVDQRFPQAAAFVRDSLHSGIARVGVEFRCNVDFTAQRVRQGLKALKDAILSLGRDTTSTAVFPPFVCTATPEFIKWDEAPQSISLAGYDFRPTGITATVIGTTGQMSDITAALTQPSPYQLILNLTKVGAAFPRDCIRVELRAQGSVISTLSCLTDCPAGQPSKEIPAKEVIVLDETHECGDTWLTGCRFDKNTGGACPKGHFRKELIEITKVAGKGNGNCGEGNQSASAGQLSTHWQSSNPADCSIHEHIGLAGGTAGGFWTCRFVVTAVMPKEVIDYPPPRVGWCGAQ